MLSRRRSLLLAALLVVILGVVSFPARRYLAAIELLKAMSSEDRSLPPEPGELYTKIALPSGERLRARVYGPSSGDAPPTIVLVHGIHHRGIDEPRLIRFARHLAARGCRVLTPELRELADYQVTQSGVAAVRAAVEHASKEQAVGLIGFSFGGGLSLLAATDSNTAQRLRYVASVGGYHDLHRSLRFLATHEVEGPNGARPRRAHEYGLLVLLYGHLEHFALGEDLLPFRGALKSWLMEDRVEARRHAAGLKTEAARQLFSLLEKQELSRISRQLLDLLKARERLLLDLSPAGRLKDVQTEVLLLHGAGDSVVPPEETLFATLELESTDHPTYRTLVTPLLEHVRVENPGGWTEKYALVSLVSRFF